MTFDHIILDRIRPLTTRHIDRYPIRTLLPTAPAVAEHTVALPDYRVNMDQGAEGACVGFGETWVMSAIRWRRYDAEWLYRQCKLRDGEPDVQGTWLSYGFDVLREVGHRRFVHNVEQAAQLEQGTTANRWATTVDDVRATIAADYPVALGIDWYSNFDNPQLVNNEYWIGLGNLGFIRGGHCICAYRVSDKRQAVRLVNSWGLGFPLVWLPYTVLGYLLDNGGECGVVTPR